MTWPAFPLDELGTVARGRSRHRPRDAEYLYGGPYAFVQTGDVKKAPLYLREFTQTYSEAGLSQSKLWPKGTLCITIAANIAETAILDIDACFPDSISGFIPDEKKTSAKFVKYQFDALLKTRMKRVSQGAAQENLSQQKLLSFKFPIPELITQKNIVKTLSNYDDLIENNRRRITLLEESAHLLYREWFVHYRFPENSGTYSRDNLPEGWEEKTIGEYAPFKYGKSLKSEDREEGTVNVYGSSGIIGTHTKSIASGPGVIIGQRGNVGSVFYEEQEFWPIDTTYFSDGPKTSLFLFFALKHTTFINTGVAVPGLNRDLAHSRKIVVPDERLVDRFNEIVISMFKQIHNCKLQNDQLTKARDMLLPRLMDGRIEI